MATTEVYRNLHKHCWSVRVGGLVKHHSHYVILKDAFPRISQAGRGRVLEQKSKNVHARLCSKSAIEIVDQPERMMADDIKHARQISYNPYKHDYFYVIGEESLAFCEGDVILCGNEVWALGGSKFRRVLCLD